MKFGEDRTSSFEMPTCRKTLTWMSNADGDGDAGVSAIAQTILRIVELKTLFCYKSKDNKQ